MASDRPPSGARIALASASSVALLGALIFVPAGRLDWIAGWVYFAALTTGMAVGYGCIRARNPELIAHRMRMGRGTKGWDKVWLSVFSLVFLTVYVVAGLDAVRYGWSGMPLWLWPVGLGLLAAGTALFIWPMTVNPFFEKTVRIQTERGHRVIDSGPYRFIRHPGYVGFLGWILSVPLMLGSWWAFVPALAAAALVVIRTALEDRMLRNELPGYADYANRVRFRLIPSVW